MACLIIEIIMLLSGIYVLITAKFKLTDRFYLRGWRARVAGLFWVAPLPVIILAGMMAGILIGIGILPESFLSNFTFIEPLIVIGGLVGSLVFAYATE